MGNSMGRILPFKAKGKPANGQETSLQVGGTVEIWPSDAHGGCWAVFHRSRSGESLGHVGDFFALDEAETASRTAAKHYGATLDTGVPHV